MKKTLHLPLWFLLCISLFQTTNTWSQTLLLSEEFSGLKTGSHSSPSTYDISALLDQKLQTPGWTGYRIYEAGTEAKLGIASTPGWIESPQLKITEGSQLTLSFDLASWPGDNATVQLYLNGNPYGSIISPPDTFKKELIQLSGITGDLKIKVAGVSKRFFIDNFSLVSDIVNKITDEDENYDYRIFPVPVAGALNIESLKGGEVISVFSLTGQNLQTIFNSIEGKVTIDTESLIAGAYIIRITRVSGYSTTRLIIKK